MWRGTRTGAVISAGLAALALGACGSSGGSGSSFAKQPAATIFSDSLSAVTGAKSYEFSGTIDQSGTEASAMLTYVTPGNFSAQITEGSRQASIIALSQQAYIKANAAYWSAESSSITAAQAAKLAGQWLQVKRADAGLTGLDTLKPTALASCLKTTLPNPKVTGTATVDGQSTVVLHSDGGAFGAGEMYVATTAPHYPLRFTRTKARSASAASNICEQGTGSAGTGSVDLSKWNTATVTAPAHSTPAS